MDIITEASISYDHLSHLPTFSRSHIKPEDGIELKGNDFFGFISKNNAVVKVYFEEGYFKRNFVPWGHDEKRARINAINQQIKEKLYDSCVK